MKKNIFFLALILTLVLVGAACSSSPDTTEEESEEAAETSTGPSKEEIRKLSGPEMIRLAHQLAEAERAKIAGLVRYCQPGPTLADVTITGLQEKNILGVKLQMCHFQGAEKEAYQFQSWHDDGGAQSIIYSETQYPNHKVYKGLIVSFPTPGLLCSAQNLSDVTDRQLKLNCEDF